MNSQNGPIFEQTNSVMNNLYPLVFKPILKDKIWGGQKLTQLLGKKAPNLPNIGESWELSGVDNNISVVTNGFLKDNNLNELIEIYMGDMVGDKIYEKFGTQFPLLIKFIDATDDLSIQVHPNDEVAMERHDSYGKTEMWYIMQADKGARLISGFRTEVTCESYLKHLEEKKLSDILGYHEVSPGDVFFMPAGRVHAIGAGIMLAEIQQTSDITYRIYDFDRVDDKGNPRELHTDQALDVIDYQKLDEPKMTYKPAVNKPVEVVSCEYFTTNVLDLNSPMVMDYYHLDSFVIYICVDGAFEISGEAFEKLTISTGQTVLIPSECKQFLLSPIEKTRLLEVYIK
jgi:mannose-6-phosphate isomerase